MDSILEGLDSYQDMADQVLADASVREGFRALILDLVYGSFTQRPRSGETPRTNSA